MSRTIEHPDRPGIYTTGAAQAPGRTEPRWGLVVAGPPVKVEPGEDGPSCACCGSENLRRYRVLRGPMVRKTVGVACARNLLRDGYLTITGALKVGLI